MPRWLTRTEAPTRVWMTSSDERLPFDTRQLNSPGRYLPTEPAVTPGGRATPGGPLGPALHPLLSPSSLEEGDSLIASLQKSSGKWRSPRWPSIRAVSDAAARKVQGADVYHFWCYKAELMVSYR